LFSIFCCISLIKSSIAENLREIMNYLNSTALPNGSYEYHNETQVNSYFQANRMNVLYLQYQEAHGRNESNVTCGIITAIFSFLGNFHSETPYFINGSMWFNITVNFNTVFRFDGYQHPMNNISISLNSSHLYPERSVYLGFNFTVQLLDLLNNEIQTNLTTILDNYSNSSQQSEIERAFVAQLNQASLGNVNFYDCTFFFYNPINASFTEACGNLTFTRLVDASAVGFFVQESDSKLIAHYSNLVFESFVVFNEKGGLSPLIYQGNMTVTFYANIVYLYDRFSKQGTINVISSEVIFPQIYGYEKPVLERVKRMQEVFQSGFSGNATTTTIAKITRIEKEEELKFLA